MLCALLLVDVFVRGSAGQGLLIAPWMLLLLWGAYLVWIASRITTDDTGVTVQNLLRRTRAPWARVTGVEVRWQVEFALDDGSRLRAFGGPAPSRAGRRSTPGAADAQAARIVENWSAAADRGEGPVQRSWDAPALIALVVIAVWAAVAVLVAGA